MTIVKVKNYNNFDIQFQKPITKQIYDPPKDILDEFYDFEMSFKRFFYEYNHYISLEIGNDKIELHLYHDILDAFEFGLCKQINLLSNRQSVSIDIENIELEFVPIEDKDEVICHVRFIGTGKSNSYVLRLSQVIERMSEFIEKILRKAIENKYISYENISELVEWQLDDR